MEIFNRIKSLNFSGPHISALCVENVRDYKIGRRTIVVNPTLKEVIIDEAPNASIRPLHSAILKETSIKKAELLILLTVEDEVNMGNIILEKGWALLGEQMGPVIQPSLTDEISFPLNTPLWKSPQDDVHTLMLDPQHLTGQVNEAGTEREFTIKANLWFATASTNCFIHNKHDFIEIHTQVYGVGRMQKFKEQRADTLYLDEIMSEGYSTPYPYCISDKEGNNFTYPWHQYYADSDCIWMAIEFHPVLR